MKFTIPNITQNPVQLMRGAGYAFQRNVDGGEISFVRPLARGRFPRFHVYTRSTGTDLQVSIHIDHKEHTYGDSTRHQGEYDNDGALGPEIERLKQLLDRPAEQYNDYGP